MHIVKRTLLVFTLMLSVSLCHAQSSIDELKAHYFDAAREGNVELLQAFYQAGLDGNVTMVTTMRLIIYLARKISMPARKITKVTPH